MAIPLCKAGCSRVTHPFATFLQLPSPESSVRQILVRLACVKHAASVRPEPGSNSLFKVRPLSLTSFPPIIVSSLYSQSYYHCSLFLVRCHLLRPLYYIRPLCLCQYLFVTFFLHHIYYFLYQLFSWLSLKCLNIISTYLPFVNTFFPFFVK